MSRTIRKLMAWVLFACLLLASAAAAETGKLTLDVSSAGKQGLQNLGGVTFELYKIGVPDGSTDSAWAPNAAAGFGSVELLTEAAANGKEWSAEEIQRIIGEAEKAMVEATAPCRTRATDPSGKVTFDNLEPGIYYVVKPKDSSPKRLKVNPFLFAVPSLNSEDPNDVTYDLSASGKMEYTPLLTDIQVKKKWEDDNDFDKIRPESITVRLLRDGAPTTEEEKTLNSSNGWEDKWTDLPGADDDGKEYVYTVEEDQGGLPDGYVCSGAGTKDNDYTITNTHEVVYGALKIKKTVTFPNATNLTAAERTRLGNYAAGLTFRFFVTGPKELKEEDRDEDHYLNEEKYELKVDASSLTRELVISKRMPGTYTVREDTSNLPEGMQLAGDNDIEVKVEANTTAETAGTAAFNNPQSLCSLKIVKKVSRNGESTTSTDLDHNYVFDVFGPDDFSKLAATRTISVKSGKSAPAQVDNLLPGKYRVVERTGNLPSNTQVSYDGGNEKELTVANTSSNPVTFTVTNNRTVTPPPPPGSQTTPPTPDETPRPTSISGRKVWVDDSNAHNTRPASITVELLANGEVVDSKTVTGKSDRWSYSFTGLDRTDDNGNPITYTVREVEVSGYTTTVSGTTITNELIPRTTEEYTSLNGIKTWVDNNNADGIRPNYIVVRLLRDGEAIDSRTVTAANGWQYTFSDLPKDDGYGKTYEYEIREDAVPGYFLRTDGYNLINSRLPGSPPPNDRTEEELEDLTDLPDYGTPLFGELLGTGDDTPLYPFIFGGIGGLALIALIVLKLVDRRRRRNAA